MAMELMWDGKYTADGKRSAPVRIALPFQAVETVNESARQRQLMLDFFTSGQESEWRNRLIWGDKKYVLPSLLPEFAEKIDLIYIDPPFDTGADFSFSRTIPGSDTSFIKEPNTTTLLVPCGCASDLEAGSRPLSLAARLPLVLRSLRVILAK